jgi:hypothetical protein
MRRQTKYTFHFVNLCKKNSLYCSGMRPLMYSDHLARTQNLGWHRCGEDIVYFPNARRRDGRGTKPTFTLSFQLEFPHDHDRVYLAHCYPYSYSELQEYLRGVERRPEAREFWERAPLCQTEAGNSVDLVTITSGVRDLEGPAAQDRPAVFISARVHPGESNSSWVMKVTPPRVYHRSPPSPPFPGRRRRRRRRRRLLPAPHSQRRAPCLLLPCACSHPSPSPPLFCRLPRAGAGSRTHRSTDQPVGEQT